MVGSPDSQGRKFSTGPDSVGPASGDALVCVGMFRKPFGIKGEVRLASYCEQPESIFGMSPLCSEDGANCYEIKDSGRRGHGLVARIDRVKTREQAALLNGIRLYARRSAFPEPPDDEFYHADLVGLEVRDRAGNRIGCVRGVLNHGAGDILDVATADEQSLLVPFTRNAAPIISLVEQLVVVDLDGI